MTTTPVARDVSLIVIGYNQEVTIQAIMDAIVNGTMLPEEIVVIDNGSDDGTAQRVAIHPLREVVSLHYEYRAKDMPDQVGRRGFSDVVAARNLGYSVATKDIIVSLDGDCIPDQRFIAAHLDIHMRLPNLEVATVGPRFNISPREATLPGVQKYLDAAILKPDYRTELYGIFASERELEYLDINHLSIKPCFWSCNYSVRRNSCERVNQLLQKLKGRLISRAEIFDSDFNNNWGWADAFFASCLYYSGTAAITNRNAIVYHVDHPSRENRQNEALFFRKLDQLRGLTSDQWGSNAAEAAPGSRE